MIKKEGGVTLKKLRSLSQRKKNKITKKTINVARARVKMERDNKRSLLKQRLQRDMDTKLYYKEGEKRN